MPSQTLHVYALTKLYYSKIARPLQPRSFISCQMYANGVESVSQDMANLGLDGQGHPPGFAAFDQPPPPPPKLNSRGVVAMDITNEFTAAAKKLDMGQLIKDPFFTLFEAVGSLEIMDAKMDSGYLAPGETMDAEYDFEQNLLPEEIIGIIDQLLCHEMAWHMGYPLAQTIFTSLYIDRILSPYPTKLEQTVFDRSESSPAVEPLAMGILRAYCLGLIKTCYFVNSRVKAEHFYEEEDFVTHTFNQALLDNFDISDIQDVIKNTINRLSASDDIESSLKKALLSRLELRSVFLNAVELADSRTSFDVKELWNRLLSLTSDVKSSAGLGKPVPTAFSVKIQRKLASTVPPRPVIEVSQKAAFTHLEQICKDASVAVDVLKYYDTHSLMTFVFLFQARKPQPSVYIRTLLQHYLFADMIVLGTMSIRHVLDDDLASTVLPAHQLLDRTNDEIEVPHDPRHIMATRMELFRSRASGSYLDILRGICQNRCRIRRTLFHTIIDWDNLQLDAEELDQDLRQYTKEVPIADPEVSDQPIFEYPLSSWAYYYKLQQMEWQIQLGFELEVFPHDELASMYWYLQYLAKTRIRHIERIRGFVVRRYTATRRSPKVTNEQKQEYADALTFLTFATNEATATCLLAEALSCMFAVLMRLNLIQRPVRPYSDDHMRYEVQMKPFLSIGLPELIPLDELNRLVHQSGESTLDIIEFAADAVASAKKKFENLSKLTAKESFSQGCHDHWVKNIKDCLKACIFTGLSVAGVKKAVEKAGKGKSTEVKGIKVEIPATGFGYHDWWIVPKVVPDIQR